MEDLKDFLADYLFCRIIGMLFYGILIMLTTLVAGLVKGFFCGIYKYIHYLFVCKKNALCLNSINNASTYIFNHINCDFNNYFHILFILFKPGIALGEILSVPVMSIVTIFLVIIKKIAFILFQTSQKTAYYSISSSEK